RFGGNGDVPISGDWNGDGQAQIGFYNNGVWTLDLNGNGRFDEGEDWVKDFGGPDSIPIVGDWDGDGIDSIGYFDRGKWTLDVHGDRSAVISDSFDPKEYQYQDGDVAVAGDWNGDGIDEIAVYRSGQGATTAENAPAQSQTPEKIVL
ncbi:MAG: hypothetical protein II596_07785, partial [Thermoguttaceae bacterium]|nr:hypothetical protein [Thermoguttaceae bacterium]